MPSAAPSLEKGCRDLISLSLSSGLLISSLALPLNVSLAAMTSFCSFGLVVTRTNNVSCALLIATRPRVGCWWHVSGRFALQGVYGRRPSENYFYDKSFTKTLYDAVGFACYLPPHDSHTKTPCVEEVSRSEEARALDVLRGAQKDFMGLVSRAEEPTGALSGLCAH